jgi:hypothetical protein
VTADQVILENIQGCAAADDLLLPDVDGAAHGRGSGCSKGGDGYRRRRELSLGEIKKNPRRSTTSGK